jgi:hypothetical protein
MARPIQYRLDPFPAGGTVGGVIICVESGITQPVLVCEVLNHLQECSPMRSPLIVATLAAACSMFSAAAFAAVCTPSAGSIVSIGTINGDLCAATNQLATTCADATAIGNSRDAIYQVQLGAVNNATFSVTGTGFDPYVALMNGPSCNSINTCPSENAGSAGMAVIIDPPDNLPAGTYFLFITEQSGSTACGAFALTANSVPVTLQQFSVD